MQANENLTVYEIGVKGHIDERWMRWFEGLDVSLKPNGETILSGLMDQAALHGVLNRIRDLGLDLQFVRLKKNKKETKKEFNNENKPN